MSQCLDELLSDKVCQSLVDRLRSQYLGQIVQILINLEHFEIACRELEQILLNARSVNSAGGSVILGATESFKSHKKTAEKRIFEVVNSKIDDLVEIAQYDWYGFRATVSDRHGRRPHTTTSSLKLTIEVGPLVQSRKSQATTYKRSPSICRIS